VFCFRSRSNRRWEEQKQTWNTHVRVLIRCTCSLNRSVGHYATWWMAFVRAELPAGNCTLQNSRYLQWSISSALQSAVVTVRVPPVVTSQNLAFFQHGVLVCFVWFCQHTVVISIASIVLHSSFVMEMRWIFLWEKNEFFKHSSEEFQLSSCQCLTLENVTYLWINLVSLSLISIFLFTHLWLLEALPPFSVYILVYTNLWLN